MSDMIRRDFIALLPRLPPVLQGTAPAPLRLQGFNHVSLTVSDLQRSIDFYRGLFGLALQSRQGSETAALQIGAGPQHIGLSTNPSSGVRTPRIDRA